MGLFDRVKNAAKLAVEAGVEVANKAVEVAETTKQAYKEGGTEALGRLAGEATKKAVEVAKDVGSGVADYASEAKKVGEVATKRANLIRDNDADKTATAAILATMAVARKIRDDATNVGKNAIDALDSATKENPDSKPRIKP